MKLPKFRGNFLVHAAEALSYNPCIACVRRGEEAATLAINDQKQQPIYTCE